MIWFKSKAQKEKEEKERRIAEHKAFMAIDTSSVTLKILSRKSRFDEGAGRTTTIKLSANDGSQWRIRMAEDCGDAIFCDSGKETPLVRTAISQRWHDLTEPFPKQHTITEPEYPEGA